MQHVSPYLASLLTVQSLLTQCKLHRWLAEPLPEEIFTEHFSAFFIIRENSFAQKYLNQEFATESVCRIQKMYLKVDLLFFTLGK